MILEKLTELKMRKISASPLIGSAGQTKSPKINFLKMRQPNHSSVFKEIKFVKVRNDFNNKTPQLEA
jgi:hypothetical protein